MGFNSAFKGLMCKIHICCHDSFGLDLLQFVSIRIFHLSFEYLLLVTTTSFSNS